MPRAKYIEKPLLWIFPAITGVIFSAPSVMAAPADPPKIEESAKTDPFQIYVESGATAEQKKRIEDLAKAFESVNMHRSRAIMGLIQDIRSLSSQPELDEKKLMDDQKQINELQAQISADRTRLLIRIRKTLTHEQRVKLVRLIDAERGKSLSAAGSTF